MTDATAPAAGTRTLARALGPADIVFLAIGSVIGSGIFIVPAAVLRQTGGNPGPALIVWVVGGVLSLLGALAYAEMAAMRPEAGGLYIFIRDAFGPLPAFVYGWTLFFAIASGAVATLSVASVAYIKQLIPIPDGAGKLPALILIAAVTAINVRGTKQSAGVQNVTTIIKTSLILVMSLMLIILGTGWRATMAQLWPDHLTSGLLSGIGLAMIGILWAYEGWQFVTFSVGETRDPQRNFPRGFVGGTAALIAIYLIANLGYLAALGPDKVQQADAVAAEAVREVFGVGPGKLVAAVIWIAMFSAANSILLTAPRVYYAMARDGVFFRKLAEVHPRLGTPAFAILAGAGWTMFLAAMGTFEQLFTYVVFSGWIFYGLAAASIFVFRRREPHAPRPFRCPGYPWVPALFVLSAATIVVNTIISQPKNAAIGLALVFSAVPFYFVWRRRR
jgi:basic amino acid/polyamine antiporter, APA family